MKTIEEYLALPYTFAVRWDKEDSLFVARVQEIPRCSGHGSSASQAIEMAQDNLQEWIAASLEDNAPIPIPVAVKEMYSGKWLQRVSKSVHAKAARLADQEGVSLNQLVSGLICEAVGEKLSNRSKSYQAAACKVIDLEAAASSWHQPIYLSHSMTALRSSMDDLCEDSIPNKYTGDLIEVITRQARKFGVSETRRGANGKKENQFSYNA